MIAARILTLLAVLTVATAALAQAPAVVPVQGSLFDESGAPVDAVVPMDFTLYDDSERTAVIHQETIDVDVDDGFFTVYLGGADVDLDLALFAANPTAFLGIAVDDDPEMDPIEVATVPYAAFCDVAGEAEAIDGLSSVALRSWDACEVGQAVRALSSDGTVTCTPVVASAHDHDADEVTAGTLSTERFDAYADLVEACRVAGALDCIPHPDGADLLTAAEGNTRFLNTAESHAHSAEDITSGTLNLDRFNAMPNLNLNGFLNGDSDTDLVLKSQGDDWYVNEGDTYDDLSEAGRLDNNEAPDLITVGQARGLFLELPEADLRYWSRGDIYVVSAEVANVSAYNTVSVSCSDDNDIPLVTNCFAENTDIVVDDMILSLHRVRNVTDRFLPATLECGFNNWGTDNNIDIHAEMYCIDI